LLGLDVMLAGDLVADALRRLRRAGGLELPDSTTDGHLDHGRPPIRARVNLVALHRLRAVRALP
jgi:hypothetical protein